MSDLAKPALFLSHAETARRLGIGVATVGRLLNDGALDFVKQRTQRKPYRAQVEHIEAALAAGRTGSIKEFAAEWRAELRETHAATA